MFDFDEESEEFQGGASEVLDNLEEGLPADHQMTGEEYANDVMDTAMQRIEEANLFKTLINQDIFAKNSARAEILDSVNGKIKQFAIKELESLLGIRSRQEAAIVSSPFDDAEVESLKTLSTSLGSVELKVLKMLINQVFQKYPNLANEAAAAVVTDRKPTLNQIQAPTPTLNQVKAPAQAPVRKAALAPARRQEAPAAAAPQPGQKRKRQKAGQTTPNAQTKVKPMPDAGQLMQTMGTPGVVASRALKGSAGASEQEMNRGIMSVGDVVARLTGGNILAVDDSNPADAALEGGGSVDVNGRF